MSTNSALNPLASVLRMVSVLLIRSTARVSRPSKVVTSGVRNDGPMISQINPVSKRYALFNLGNSRSNPE